VIRTFLLATALSLSIGAATVTAQEQALTPAAAEQIVLAETLVRYGEARKDPILLIAAARIAKGITAEGPAPAAKLPTMDEILASAIAYSDGDEVIAAMVDDVKASQSKGYCYGSHGTGWC
jgi:hypothetical protein